MRVFLYKSSARVFIKAFFPPVEERHVFWGCMQRERLPHTSRHWVTNKAGGGGL